MELSVFQPKLAHPNVILVSGITYGIMYSYLSCNPLEDVAHFV